MLVVIVGGWVDESQYKAKIMIAASGVKLTKRFKLLKFT